MEFRSRGLSFPPWAGWRGCRSSGLRGSATGTWGGHKAMGNQSVERMSRRAKKAKETVPAPACRCSPMAMMIVVIARGFVAGKRGAEHAAEAGPATSALARLLMSRPDWKTVKLTPGRLEAFEKIAATLTTSAEPYEELYEVTGLAATQRGPE